MATPQYWQRLYSYIEEYQSLVYDYYSKQGLAFLTTYYGLNKESTVWDNEEMFNGSYEKLGDLSGIKWNKYLLLPVYFIDEISTSFDATETGYNKLNETSFVIPSSYGITPYPGDFVKLEQNYLQPNNNTHPLLIVGGVDIHPNTDKRFWKLKVSTEQSNRMTQLNEQTEDTFVFFDYDKTIHTLDDSITLTNLLNKQDKISKRLKSLWNENSGFYQTL